MSVVNLNPEYLTGPLVVEHVCHGHETVGFSAIDDQTENARDDHQTCPDEFVVVVLRKRRYVPANIVIFGTKRILALGNLVKTHGTLEQAQLLLIKENRHVAVFAGQCSCENRMSPSIH